MNIGDFVKFVSGFSEEGNVQLKEIRDTNSAGILINRVIVLSNSKVVIAFAETVKSGMAYFPKLYVIVCTINDNDISVGNPVLLQSAGSNRGGGVDMISISENKLLLIYSSSYVSYRFGTINGNNIILTNAIQITDVTYVNIKIIKLTENKIIVCACRHYQDANSMPLIVQLFEINENSISQISSIINTTKYSGKCFDIIPLSENKFIAVYQRYQDGGYSKLCACLYTIDEKTITAGVQTQVASIESTYSPKMIEITKLTSTKLLVSYCYSTSAWCLIITINGDILTTNTNSKVVAEAVKVIRNIRLSNSEVILVSAVSNLLNIDLCNIDNTNINIKNNIRIVGNGSSLYNITSLYPIIFNNDNLFIFYIYQRIFKLSFRKSSVYRQAFKRRR